MSHDRSGSQPGACPDGNRSDEHGPTADKGSWPNDGGVLVYTVVIAGNRSSPDVDIRTDLGVADIREVTHLGARRQVCVFDLAKVAHVYAFAKMGLGAEMSKRADLGARIHPGTLHHRGDHPATVANLRITDHGIGPKHRVASDHCLAFEHGIGVDHRILTQLHRGIDIRRCRIHHGDSGQHPVLVYAPAQHLFCPG